MNNRVRGVEDSRVRERRRPIEYSAEKICRRESEKDYGFNRAICPRPLLLPRIHSLAPLNP
jgi:hypothetical protein